MRYGVKSKVEIVAFQGSPDSVLARDVGALRELVLVFHTGHEDLRGGTLPIGKWLPARFPQSGDQIADLESSLVKCFDE